MPIRCWMAGCTLQPDVEVWTDEGYFGRLLGTFCSPHAETVVAAERDAEVPRSYRPAEGPKVAR